MHKNPDKHQMLDHAVYEYAVMHGLQTLTKTETRVKKKDEMTDRLTVQQADGQTTTQKNENI